MACSVKSENTWFHKLHVVILRNIGKIIRIDAGDTFREYC